MEKKYDVFISCKSEDYKLAEEVYHFLVENGFYTFLSSKELRKMKDAEYMDAISEALDSAYHLIVLATSIENVKSKWVKFEWSTFLNEQLSGRKQGQIMSILSGLEVCDLPIQLRHYESFTPKDYQGKILSYIETPEYLKRKREAEERAKLEEEKRKQEKEAKEKRELLIKSIEEDTVNYMIHSSSLESKALQIIEKQKLIGRIEKKCPVCGTVNAIERYYCDKCGWNFNPVFESSPQCDKEQLFLMQGLWGHIRTTDKQKEAQNKKIADLEINLRTCKEERDNLKDKLYDFQKNINTLEGELRRKSSELEIVKRELFNTKQQWKDACSEKKENDKVYASKLKLLEDKYNSALAEIERLKNDLKVQCKTSNNSICQVGAQSDNIEQRGISYKKLSKSDLIDSIIKCCDKPLGSIFGTDKLNDIGFDEAKLKILLLKEYGLRFSTFSFSTCITFNDIKQVVANKAGIIL